MITIIDYKIGNLASIANALTKLKIPYQISSNPDIIENAQALILPGVGAAGQGMANLKMLNLIQPILDQTKKGTPILGICLGMQLLLSSSEEGNVNCLGIIKGNVKKLNTNQKIPQIGWNTIRHSGTQERARLLDRGRKRLLIQQEYSQNQKQFDPGQARMTLLNNIPDNSYFYFINSYICIPNESSIVTATTEYENEFCSIFKKNNIYGTQFHPEKSGSVGLQLLRNFYMSFRAK